MLMHRISALCLLTAALVTSGPALAQTSGGGGAGGTGAGGGTGPGGSERRPKDDTASAKSQRKLATTGGGGGIGVGPVEAPVAGAATAKGAEANKARLAAPKADRR